MAGGGTRSEQAPALPRRISFRGERFQRVSSEVRRPAAHAGVAATGTVTASGALMTYNAMELMICCAARQLENGRTVAVGTGVPCAAAMLAQRTHAPNLVILFEAGGLAPQLPTMPISVSDSRSFYRAVMATSMADIMETCQRGLIDYTFLGGAQIDAFGNLNSTMIGGEYARPKVRLPGS